MRTILIADDDQNLRLLVSLTVDIPGYEVVEAASGNEVLRVLETRRVDLIVLDWMMPGLTGIEVARQLRADPAYASTPIVMLTARTQYHDFAQAKEVGIHHYLIKPFSPIELLETVERALGASAGVSATAGPRPWKPDPAGEFLPH